MKGLVNDTIWFRGPDGGEVKMSMGGYPPKEVQRLKLAMTVGGWEVTSHETTVQSDKWTLPTWVMPFLFGVSIGLLIGAQLIRVALT